MVCCVSRGKQARMLIQGGSDQSLGGSFSGFFKEHDRHESAHRMGRCIPCKAPDLFQHKTDMSLLRARRVRKATEGRPGNYLAPLNKASAAPLLCAWVYRMICDIDKTLNLRRCDSCRAGFEKNYKYH